MLEIAGTNLDREGASVLAPVAGLERDGFARGDALPDALDGRLVKPDFEIAAMPADQLLPAVAQTVAGLAVDVDNGRMIVEEKEGVGRIVHEGAEPRLARAQLVFCPLALCDVTHQAQKPVAVLLKMALANLDRERAPVPAPVAGLESDGFPGEDALPYARDGHLVKAHIEVASMSSRSVLPACSPDSRNPRG